ncbi:MAG: hypothetical protein ITG01_07045 [Comamonas sp.]|nr:hypothetical protein [Comamonas sp.]
MKVTLVAQKSMKQQVSVMLLSAALVYLPFPVAAEGAQTYWEERQVLMDCAALLQQTSMYRAFQLVKVRLQAQGMQLQAQGCPFVRTGFGDMQQVLDVRVWVVDSEIASQYVRGPLADGEAVDMGDVQLALPIALQTLAVAQDDISPDVEFNRQWLKEVMQAQGLRAVSGHWWAFLPGQTKKH